MGEMGEVWLLRSAVIRHPVHSWARDTVDQATLLVHRGFGQWGSSRLAASLGVTGAQRHLSNITTSLRDRGAGRCFEGFLEAVEQGMTPVSALPAGGGPAAAGPLVGAVCQVASAGTEAARLGAFGLGLVCCGRHQAPALDRLAALMAHQPEAEGQAAAGAKLVLRAQVSLYDGALEAIRRRHMACHPSARRPRVEPGATRSDLLPAG